MENLEIFDKNGKALHIADVIYSFIENTAKENNKDIEDVLVGVDVGFPKGETPVWIYTTEPVNNGYDALDLNNFGNPVKVNCI
jgi:deoxyribose-phosphate aldolase